MFILKWMYISTSHTHLITHSHTPSRTPSLTHACMSMYVTTSPSPPGIAQATSSSSFEETIQRLQRFDREVLFLNYSRHCTFLFLLLPSLHPTPFQHTLSTQSMLPVNTTKTLSIKHPHDTSFHIPLTHTVLNTFATA